MSVSVSADVDLAVVGTGPVGSAIALRFVEVHPHARVALVGPVPGLGSASRAAGAMLAAFGELDAGSLASDAGRARLAIGREAPEIEGNDIDGVPFKLSDYRGKIVVLDFWGNW